MSSSAQHDQFQPRRIRARQLALAAATVAATSGLTLGALPGAAAAAAHAPRPAVASAPSAVAYAYGNQPSSRFYRPERGYSFNSTGGTIHIGRSAAGTYTVRFAGLGAFAGGGTVDVTAEGLQPAECEVTHWAPDSTGTILLVGVDCFNLSGAKMDAPFMAAFTSGGSSTGTTDYVWANKPTSSSYTPSLPFQFNSSGGTNTIQRLGTGQYKVILPGPVAVGGTVKVTAYGLNNANSCQVDHWSDVSPGQDVFVDCFSPAGTPVNNKFTMTFTASDDLLGDGAPGGYLWADQPTAASYTPSTLYQYDTAGTTATVTMLQTGEWETLFPSEADGAQGDQQATAYGSTPAHCIVDGPIGNGTSEQGDVFCFDTGGNPLDTLYTTQWMVG